MSSFFLWVEYFTLADVCKVKAVFVMVLDRTTQIMATCLYQFTPNYQINIHNWTCRLLSANIWTCQLLNADIWTFKHQHVQTSGIADKYVRLYAPDKKFTLNFILTKQSQTCFNEREEKIRFFFLVLKNFSKVAKLIQEVCHFK